MKHEDIDNISPEDTASIVPEPEYEEGASTPIEFEGFYTAALCTRCSRRVVGVRPHVNLDTLLCIGCEDVLREQKQTKFAIDVEATLRALNEDARCCCAKCRTERPNGFAGCSVCIAEERRQHDETIHQMSLRQALECIPRRYMWCRFDAPELGKRVRSHVAIDRVRRLDLRAVGIATLVGPAGVGKTVLACARYHSEIDVPFVDKRFGYSSRFVGTKDLAAAKASHRLGKEQPEVIGEALEASLLVLDDLGAEGNTEIAKEVVRQVVHTRYENGAPTIVTTGLTPDQVTERYGDGVARRLFESCFVDVGAIKSKRLEAVK